MKIMKRKSLIPFLSGLFVLAVTPNADAQPADRTAAAAPNLESGTIAGRVRNGVTGRYLNKARISIKGTAMTVYTDEFGVFQLPGVRSGTAVLEVFYTDLDLAEIALEVPKGGRIEQNVDLTSAARYGQNPAIVKLDSFVVLADTEADAKSIAVNEQRFAPNIKNVLSVDALGAVLGSTVGEFLKYIPGVTAEFDQADIKEMSIRGIGSGMTSMMADGTPVNIAAQSSTRNIDIRSLSLNDYSRVEVTKVPTPSTPADSLAGSINMISKSAFERSRAQFRYGITLDANSENFTLKKTPDSNGDRYTAKIKPGFDFEYSLPVSNKFGVVISGMHSSKFNEQHSTSTTYENAGTATGASFTRPYLQGFSLLDGPRHLTRDTVSFKVDWRVTPHSVLSIGGQANIVETEIGSLSFSTAAGSTGSPTLATGASLSYGDNFAFGATGRGTVSQNPNHKPLPDPIPLKIGFPISNRAGHINRLGVEVARLHHPGSIRAAQLKHVSSIGAQPATEQLLHVGRRLRCDRGGWGRCDRRRRASGGRLGFLAGGQSPHQQQAGRHGPAEARPNYSRQRDHIAS